MTCTCPLSGGTVRKKKSNSSLLLRDTAVDDGLIWGSLNSLSSEATGTDTELKAAPTIPLKYFTVLFALVASLLPK